jgi:predicted nuclease of predicted toxin-antitoxin system
VYEEARGMEDDEVITKAFAENWILITNDKDFGEKIYRERRPHKGVVLLRLEDERTVNKIAILQRLLEGYAERLTDQFVVVTERQFRFTRM